MTKEENNAQGGQQDGDGGKKDPNSDLYEGGPKKLLRLITVMAYVFAVSFMGIALSAYYLFLWEPPNPRLIQRTHHLSAEPQAESLIADPLSDSNYSVDHLSSELNHYVPNNLLRDPANIGNDGNSFQRSIRGRKVSDKFTKDSLVNDNRAKLNDSLILLRNSLIDILKRNGSSNNGTDFNENIENNENKNLTSKGGITYDKLIGAKVKDASLTVDNVPLRTISGSAVRKDDFTSGRSIHESSPDTNRLEHNSIGSTEFAAVQDTRKTLSTSLRKKSRRREASNIEDPRTIDKMLKKEEKTLVHQTNDKLRKAERSEFPPGWQASSPKLISIAISSGDTQIDMVTKLSMTESQQQPGELGSTESPEDILTMLTESVLLEKIYSATTMSTETDPSSTHETIENSTTDQSRPFSID